MERKVAFMTGAVERLGFGDARNRGRVVDVDVLRYIIRQLVTFKLPLWSSDGVGSTCVCIRMLAVGQPSETSILIARFPFVVVVVCKGGGDGQGINIG